MTKLSDFDAVLLVSFGGPEAPEEVMPFLRNVTRGRNIPEQRLEAVAQHYLQFGGKSPINDQNRELIAHLRPAMDSAGIDLPIYWGNRNWHPMLEDTVAQMAKDGVKKAAAFVTSAYSSFSSCRQYRQDLEQARQSVAGAPELIKLRQFYNHPGFINSFVRSTRAAITTLGAGVEDVELVFTAHSIPVSMADASRYQAQLRETAELVGKALGAQDPGTIVYQSRSGPPSVPWLEPDVNDHLRQLAADGRRQVVVVPIGFVSDHMEVVFDLDHEAASTAKELGLDIARASTPGVDPLFVSMVVELIQEVTDGRISRAVGPTGPVTCLSGACCLSASEEESLPTAASAQPNHER